MGFSDSADHAVEVEDRLKEYELQRIRQNRAKSGLPFCGACYYCSTEVSQPRLWCDAYCRDDFEREQRILTMSGK
jgi:hypothetical protein